LILSALGCSRSYTSSKISLRTDNEVKLSKFSIYLKSEDVREIVPGVVLFSAEENDA
jgi:hypothetical protein